MTIFVDASALIAMIAGEPEADDLASRLEQASPGLYSAVSAWEALAGLCRSYMFSVETARATLDSFIEAAQIRLAPIGEAEYLAATEAFSQFGKGRHPAGLNMGDCFAYACAKSNRAALLFKGEDFSKTDLA